jgi:hypothetical protein
MSPDSDPELTFDQILRLARFMTERGHGRVAYELLISAIMPRLLEAIALDGEWTEVDA